MEKNYRLKRDHALIFVVDIQDRMIPAMRAGKESIRYTNALLEAAIAYDIPAVYTEQYPKGLGPTEDSTLTLLKDVKAFRAEKSSYDAYTQEIKEQLKTLGRKQIIVTGMETHICVYQTVRSLLEEGYEVFLPQDAIDSRTEKNWCNGLNLMKEMGAVVSNTETLLFDLIQTAKDKHFKQLQALIK